MNVLFICPLFHEYYKKIINIVEEKGNNVHYYPTDNLKLSVVEQFIRKISTSSLSKRYNDYIENIIETERNFVIDEVVVIYGGLYFKKEHFIKLKRTFKNAKFIYYTWDSVSNCKNIQTYYNLFDKFYSFDLIDCEKYGFEFLPLFYFDDNKINTIDVNYDYGILMTLGHLKYEKYLQVKKVLNPNFKSKEYLLMGSKSQYIYNYIRWHKYMKKINRSYIHYNPLPLASSSHFYDDCKAVVDIPLEGQNGLTIRTFEALRKQKKLITTNKNIVTYDFYTPNNIFIVDELHDKIPYDFFESRFDKNFMVGDKYSIYNFVRKLFELD